MARIVFMGTPDFAVPVLLRMIDDGYEIIVVTQPDRPAGRGRTIEMPPVKRAALEHGLAVLQPESVNTPDVTARLREWSPEAGIVAAFGQLLGSEILDLPTHGHLNVHASLLPRWRGASPIVAAILAGDEETGVTIMLIDAGLDTGPMLAKARCAITAEDTTGSLEPRLAQLGANLLSQTLPRWLRGEIIAEPQDATRATFAGHVEKNDGRVDWAQPADLLWRMSRAYEPWPGLFAFAGEQRVRLWRMLPLQGWRGDELPGEVVESYDEMLVVATGEGALILEEVQLAGKKRTSGIDFRRGQRNLRFFS